MLIKPKKKFWMPSIAPYYAAAGGGGGGYTAQGVYFDTSTSTHRGSSLTGIANSKVGTFSFWFKAVGGDGTTQTIFLNGFGTGGIFQIARDGNVSNTISFLAQDITGTNILFARSTLSFGVADGWKHVLASWNLATATIQLYVEDAADTPTSIIDTNATIDYVGAGSRDVFFGDAGGGNSNFDISDFWCDPTTFNDLTNVTFRRKFISAGLAPVDLGTTGQLPTGSTPILFCKGPTTNFLANLGTGGNFTTFSGALQAAGSNPP